MNDNDIYTIAMRAAEDGASVTVSLSQHWLKIDGGALIADGCWQGELGVPVVDESAALAMIEDAYAAYECSVPEGGNDASRWFYARPTDDLSDMELATGIDRPVARCRLEVLTLMLILNRSLRKDGQQMKGKWFWQSENHPRLVILTEWIKY